MAYATLAEVRERLGYDEATNTELVARLNDALTAATAAIDNYTGRVFTASSGTKTFGARDHYVLKVPDLTAVTTLKTDTNGDGTFDTTITDYELDTIHPDGWPYDTIRLLSDSFPVATTRSTRRRRVEIVGTWGWSAVPSPVNQACSLWAIRLAQRPARALFGIETFGELGAGMIARADPDIRALLDPYVRVGVA